MAIKFSINKQKSIEVILWIIQRGESNMYNIMKILFEADKYHLNTYGRPVTGDRYVAMPNGTVPSVIYNMIKKPSKNIGFSTHGYTLMMDDGRQPNDNFFSESDIEALQHGFDRYAGKDFGVVLKENHKENAWRKAIERKPGSKAPPIFFEDMIEKKCLIDELKGVSKFVSI